MLMLFFHDRPDFLLKIRFIHYVIVGALFGCEDCAFEIQKGHNHGIILAAVLCLYMVYFIVMRYICVISGEHEIVL